MKLLQTMVLWAGFLGNGARPAAEFLQKALMIDKWYLGIGLWAVSWLLECGLSLILFVHLKASAFSALLPVLAWGTWYYAFDRTLIKGALEYSKSDDDQMHQKFVERAATSLLFWGSFQLPLFSVLQTLILVLKDFETRAEAVGTYATGGLFLLAFFLRGWSYYVYLSPGVPPAERRLFETRQMATEGA